MPEGTTLADRGYRVALRVRRRARFHAWAAKFDFHLRRRGSRLILDAPYGASFETPPSFHPVSWDPPSATGGPPSVTLRLGANVHLGRGLTIEYRRTGENVLELGHGCHLQDSNRFVLDGGRIAMGPRGRLRSFAVLKSSGELVMGEQVMIAYNCILHCTERIELHDLVGISDRSTIIDSTHIVDGSDTYYYSQPTVATPVVLERNVIVSANVMILRGARIGRNAHVAAHAVVYKGRYPGGCMIGGNPAKKIRPLGPLTAPAPEAGNGMPSEAPRLPEEAPGP
jgi:acetyltransferase-like isoleucine patch superfamily enzyme